MTQELAKTDNIIEAVITAGDLSKLSAIDRTNYYVNVCKSIGLNPMTKPFEYITLNGKLTLYARKDATDQLRSMRHVSISKLEREKVEDVYVVTAYAVLPDGRQDSSIGAVSIGNLKGDPLANAMMKAETKAKRRVTLSICGLGMLDETELETIPTATPPADPPQPTATGQASDDAVQLENARQAWGKSRDSAKARGLSVAIEQNTPAKGCTVVETIMRMRNAINIAVTTHDANAAEAAEKAGKK